MMSPRRLRVSLPCADEMELELGPGGALLKGIGGLETLRFLAQYRDAIKGRPMAEWPLPQGVSRGALLLKRLILEARGEWKLPYADTELCHCRAVPTETVVQAIMMGAHDPQTVSDWTSASTSCGTCRPDVERLLQYLMGTDLV